MIVDDEDAVEIEGPAHPHHHLPVDESLVDPRQEEAHCRVPPR